MKKRDQVVMPVSLEAAMSELDGIQQLVSVKEWRRAAIVACFVRLDNKAGRPSNRSEVTDFLTPAQFAELGINGLRSKTTVQMYVQRWVDAKFGEYPQPGAEVVLPDEPWPPSRGGTDGYESDEGAQRTVERIIEKHGTAPVVDALGHMPRATQSDALEAMAGKVREAMDLPFDHPPAIPGEDRPLRPGYAVTTAARGVEMALHTFDDAVSRYTMGEDPVADGVMAKILSDLERSEGLIRQCLGLDNWEHV